MKGMKFLLLFLLLTVVPVLATAAQKTASATQPVYKADLSGKVLPGVSTPATGEAVFLPTGSMGSTVPGAAGAGTGGVSTSKKYHDTMSYFGTAVPGDNTGDSGPGQGFDQGGTGTPYEGIVNTDPNDTGSAAIGTAMGTWGMSDDRRHRWDDSVSDTARATGGGIYGTGAGGTKPGAAVVPVAPDSIAYLLSAYNISDVNAAYLQMGKPGTSGPVIATLFPGPKQEGAFNGLLAQGTISSADLAGPLAGKSLSDLVSLIRSGNVSVNIVTDGHPSGEISGLVRGIS